MTVPITVNEVTDTTLVIDGNAFTRNDDGTYTNVGEAPCVNVFPLIGELS